MKIPTLLIRKKKTLRASTARRFLAEPDEMDYEEMSEPNMKLSRALLIVLVLHVVAVAGIIAFNTIKSRQGAFPASTASTASAAATPAKPAAGQPPSTKPEAAPLAAAANEAPLPRREEIRAALPVGKAPLKAEPVKAAGGESGKFYVVAKGDNPVSIAKKLHVSQQDLLTVNHITDPKKLQIGQKLIVPVTKKTKARRDEN